MKISMIEMVSSHGGMNYYDFGLMMGLGKLEHDVTLYTSEPLLFDITSNKNLKVKVVTAATAPRMAKKTECW